MSTRITIRNAFAEIGARVKVNFLDRPDRSHRNVVVDVKKDRKGEYIDIRVLTGVELIILDQKPRDRHLLLMARDPNNPKARFLCGHDERHWFTAAIPEKSGASSVRQAMQALKPSELVGIEVAQRVRAKDLHKRRRKMKNGGKIFRQGEFMFIPAPDFTSEPHAVLKGEVLSRGGSPHRVQYLCRSGGRTVYVNRSYPDGLSQKQYEELISKKPELRKTGGWRVQVRDPLVHVKGKITHPEHSTLDLGDSWYRVMLNTEHKARATQNVAFID